MANTITGQCVNCGACESMCPGEGISRGEEAFVIDPTRCTECVGFYHTQQCARVCPIDCCVIDPKNVETEAVLFERAEKPDSPAYGNHWKLDTSVGCVPRGSNCAPTVRNGHGAEFVVGCP